MNNLFGSKFTLTNMKGRPALTRKLGMVDSVKSLTPNCYPKCHEDGCPQQATLKVYELNGAWWYWCGECDPGG